MNENGIRYSLTGSTSSLRIRNFNIALSNGSSPEPQNFYSSISVPSDGYVFYGNKDSGGPSIYSLSNDSELINLTNIISGNSFTQSSQCFSYYNNQSDKLLVDREYEGIVTNGLVMNIDAGFMPSYPRGGTGWGDLSGNGNNGTLTNGPAFNSGNGGSIVFDGTNDYISFGSKKTSDFGLTSSNGASMCCWLNLTLLSRWTGVFNFWRVNNECDFGWDIYPSNVLRVWKNSVQNGTFPSLSSYNNTWCYYTLTSSSSNLKFYVNDTLILNSPQTGNINSSNNSFLTFGTHWDNPIQGKSSVIQIYNRELSSQEIQQNFNATKTRYGL